MTLQFNSARFNWAVVVRTGLARVIKHKRIVLVLDTTIQRLPGEGAVGGAGGAVGGDSTAFGVGETHVTSPTSGRAPGAPPRPSGAARAEAPDAGEALVAPRFTGATHVMSPTSRMALRAPPHPF